MSIVRENLMSRKGYMPYCGNEHCRFHMPRTRYIGGQFQCGCGWRSSFEDEFIEAYEEKWAYPAPAQNAEITWENEFKALLDDVKIKVRACAKKFGVPLMHAFYRAKSLGLLAEAPPAQKKSVVAENAALRKIISDAAAALPNGAYIHPQASVGFMEGLPKEIALVCEDLKSSASSTPAPISRVTVTYAYCCNGPVKYCDCTNPNHGTVTMGANEAGDDYAVVGPALSRVVYGHSAAEIVAKIAQIATAVGFQANEPAMEMAGQIVSILAANPEHIDRFMAEGTELFLDGTFNHENGSLTYRAINGSILSPSILRERKGTQQ